MNHKDKFINHLFEYSKKDDEMLECLKNSTTIPVLESQESEIFFHNNMWKSIIYLIDKKAIDIHDKNAENENLLLKSAYFYNFKDNVNYLKFIQVLIDSGIDINEKNNVSQTFLFILLGSKNIINLKVSFIKQLESLGLNIIDEDKQVYSLGSSISHFATEEVFHYLYPKCNPFYQDAEDNNMLLNACANPELKIIEFLVSEGFKDKINIEGKNACNMALDYRQIDIFKYLIENDISHPNLIKDNKLISLSQSFNHYYMLCATHQPMEANNWLDYYFDVIDLNVFKINDLDNLKNEYQFQHMDEFYNKALTLYEKKALDNKIQVPFDNKTKIKI